MSITLEHDGCKNSLATNTYLPLERDTEGPELKGQSSKAVCKLNKRTISVDD